MRQGLVAFFCKELQVSSSLSANIPNIFRPMEQNIKVVKNLIILTFWSSKFLRLNIKTLLILLSK